MDQDESSAVNQQQLPSRSPTFGKDGSFRVDEAVGSASISPSGRDVVLASREGLHIIDLDNPYSPPRHLPHRTPWEVADVQWSPFASRDYWVVSTSNQKALVWNLDMSTAQAPIQYILHAHSRAITDINFSAHDPNKLATCAVDSFVHCWDFRQPARPVVSFADWYAGATQVKWNRQNAHIIASSHDRNLHIWDERKSATPLRTINAHATKIYGIDWSRIEATQILTCSLDMSIKLWDFSDPDEFPRRLIRTRYPVWRARHTPFGSGILAMPQRGNYDLHLYDSRSEDTEARDSKVVASPVYSFHGHRDQVKEFLWRTQGSVEDGVDHRSFQLVSWSTDRNLLLHRVDDAIFDKVGYRIGEEVNKKLTFTRQGATYKSFHDELARKPTTGHGLSYLFRYEPRAGMRKAPIPLSALDDGSVESGRGAGMRVRSGPLKQDANPITWMKGVKIGDSVSSRDRRRRMTTRIPPLEGPENLGDEIASAGEKYKKVSFEKADVATRYIVVTLSGPWGANDNYVHLKASIKFPIDYPDEAPPELKIDRTSSISDAAFTRMSVELRVICDAYASIGRGCLEAILRYLLGDRKLEESIAWVNEVQRTMAASVDRNVADSSSDEEDGILTNFNAMAPQDLEASATDVLGTINANANVPLPKACGALWADNGRLICFFPAKNNRRSAVGMIETADGEKRPRSANMFESFGRLKTFPLKTNKLPESSAVDIEEDMNSSSESSSFSSSSASSESSDSIGHFAAVWNEKDSRLRRLKAGLENSTDQNSMSRGLPQHHLDNAKQFVSLHDFSELLPSKRSLAQKYRLFGSKPELCDHNSDVAMEQGESEIASVWKLLSLILCDDVPLELLMRPQADKDILILARRALVQIKRKDSGLDLAFDGPDAVVNSKWHGRVKWGKHPLAASWMIDAIFDHFEAKGDVQMLAMMSCILSEANENQHDPSEVKSGQPEKWFATYSTALPNLMQDNLGNSSQKLPFPSTDYFSSADAALSLLSAKPSTSTAGRPATVISTLFGSYPSSNGAWSSDGNDADRLGDNSDHSSPLLMTRQNSRTSNSGQALSSSPEQVIRRASSTVGSTLATSISRQFASFLTSASSSPPNQSVTPELSTSAPTNGPSPSAITWGRNTVHWDNSNLRKVDSHASTLYDLEISSTVEEENAVMDDEDTTIVLKNQNLFDDEACANVPLLNPQHESRYRAYREAYAHLLYVWGLPLVKCEVLKFNGLVSGNPLNKSTNAEENPSPLERNSTLNASSHFPNTGLNLGIICGRCGDVVAHLADGSTCENCQTSQTRLQCSICGEAVRGLYEPCLLCGHVSHLDCVAMVLREGDGRVDDCEIGCGCLCREEGNDGISIEGSPGNTDLQSRVREELWRQTHAHRR